MALEKTSCVSDATIVVSEVAYYFDLTPEALLDRSPGNALKRAIALFLMADAGLGDHRQIARMVDEDTPDGVGEAIARIEHMRAVSVDVETAIVALRESVRLLMGAPK